MQSISIRTLLNIFITAIFLGANVLMAAERDRGSSCTSSLGLQVGVEIKLFPRPNFAPYAFFCFSDNTKQRLKL